MKTKKIKFEGKVYIDMFGTYLSDPPTLLNLGKMLSSFKEDDKVVITIERGNGDSDESK